MVNEPHTIERTPIQISKFGRKHFAEFKCWLSDKPNRKTDVRVSADSKEELQRKVAEFLQTNDLPEFK